MGPDTSQTALNEAELLFKRCTAFPPLADPMGFSIVRHLEESGRPFHVVPLVPHVSRSAFLGLEIPWRQLTLQVRQPDPGALLICHIARSNRSNALGGPLLALGSFLRFAVRECPGIDVIAGCVSKTSVAAPGELPLPRLADFYTRLVGDLIEHRENGGLWLFGKTRAPQRYVEQKIWNRRDFSTP